MPAESSEAQIFHRAPEEPFGDSTEISGEMNSTTQTSIPLQIKRGQNYLDKKVRNTGQSRIFEHLGETSGSFSVDIRKP